MNKAKLEQQQAECRKSIARTLEARKQARTLRLVYLIENGEATPEHFKETVAVLRREKVTDREEYYRLRDVLLTHLHHKMLSGTAETRDHQTLCAVLRVMRPHRRPQNDMKAAK